MKGLSLLTTNWGKGVLASSGWGTVSGGSQYRWLWVRVFTVQTPFPIIARTSSLLIPESKPSPWRKLNRHLILEKYSGEGRHLIASVEETNNDVLLGLPQYPARSRALDCRAYWGCLDWEVWESGSSGRWSSLQDCWMEYEHCPRQTAHQGWWRLQE